MPSKMGLVPARWSEARTRWLAGLAVLAHGIGHLLFMPVVAMWDGLPTSNAFFALVFDVFALVVLWPSRRSSIAAVGG